MIGSALAWLNDLAQWIGRWIPRLTLIEPTHRGVLFGPKGSARQAGPGLVFYWPLTHTLTLVPVTTQSVQLCSQMLPSEQFPDTWLPRVRMCAVAVQFRVTNPVAAATAVLNFHALIDNRTSAAVARYAATADPEQWRTLALAHAAAELIPFGLVIDRLDFTQVGTGVALKNISDWSHADHTNGKRPE